MEAFMSKWEPELECMKAMISELHEAEFPSNNADSMSNPTKGVPEVREEMSVDGMKNADVGGGSPLRQKFGSERNVTESDEENSKSKNSDEVSPVKKQSIAISIVEEEEVIVLPRKTVPTDVSMEGDN
jgi:hypothetical protein